MCLLWGECKPDDVKEVAGRLRNVTKIVIDRVDSEFPQSDLSWAMQCFDMVKVRLGMADGERSNVKQATKTVLVNGIELLAKNIEG